MSNVLNPKPRDGTPKCKQINGHKRNQQGLVKGGSNDNSKPKILISCMKHN
jgi:hypothetical protein